jgi:hypothetical protein
LTQFSKTRSAVVTLVNPRSRSVLVASAQRPPVLQFSVSCLPQAFGLPYGAVVLAVVVMALGAFLGAEWSERKFAHLRPR